MKKEDARERLQSIETQLDSALASLQPYLIARFQLDGRLGAKLGDPGPEGQDARDRELAKLWQATHGPVEAVKEELGKICDAHPPEEGSTEGVGSQAWALWRKRNTLEAFLKKNKFEAGAYN